MKTICSIFFILVLTALSCSTVTHERDDLHEPVSVTILHMNDTHSTFLPRSLSVTLPPDSIFCRLPAGSVARIATVVDSLRGAEENVLFLHAGDMVQGSLFYTLFGGEADAAVYNAMGLDAMCLGNHEFDRGSEGLAVLLEDARFPILCANVDVTSDALLSGKIEPWILADVSGEKVGIIGIVVDELSSVSSPSDNTEVLPVRETAQSMINLIEGEGVNKIILLTHIGYEDDLLLASSLSGADLIIGGHSHSVLGDLSAIGLDSEGAYPTVVSGADGEDVLVVQAGTAAAILGNLTVDFDEAGHISAYTGHPLIVTGEGILDDSRNPIEGESLEVIEALIEENPVILMAEEDAEVRDLVGIYDAELSAFAYEVVGTASEDLHHQRVPGGELPGGSVIAPVICDAMLWKMEQVGLDVDAAILNAGGARIAVPAGDITVGTIYTLMPFGNSLAVLEMSGSQIRAILEDAISNIFDDGNSDGSFPYVAGIRYSAEIDLPEGERVHSIEVFGSGDWEPLSTSGTYRIVTNAFLSRGGDGYDSFVGIEALDTGFIDAEVFMDYVLEIGILTPVESRITFSSE